MNEFTVIHVPHSSTHIPREYRQSFVKEKIPHEIEVMTDWFCDELFDVGAGLVIFPISRLVCDVERFRDDKDEIMAKRGMGAVYTSCSDLSPLRIINAEEKEKILKRLYDVHHKRFENAVDKKLQKYGKCLIVDGHSFYPTPLPYELDKSPDRADFCIGTSEFHTPKAVTCAIADVLKNKGYSVTVNSPFEGTIVPLKYYQRDKRVSSVMIEINRRLYMDSPGVKGKHFDDIKSTVQECIKSAETCLI